MQVRSIPAIVLGLLAAIGVSQTFGQEAKPAEIKAVRRAGVQAAQPAQAEKVEAQAEEEVEQPAKKDEKKADPKKQPEPEPEPRPEPKAPIDPRMIWLHLMDGAVISGRLSIDDIDVETSFGNLKVPVSSIRSFTPGMTSHPELLAQVERLVEQLGSSDFGERELAQKQLVKVGLPARDALRARADDRDTERRTRIKAIMTELDELQESVEEGDEAPPLSTEAMAQRDTMETTEFTVVGRIVQKSFSLTSPYGPLTVKLSDIRRARRETATRPDVKRNFSVEGAHLVQRSTLGTKIRLERGDRVIVEASGTLTMTPWGHQAVSTPDGAPNYGWYTPNEIPSGALVGRISDKGSFFKIGSKQTFTADRAGVLELGIGIQGDYAQNNFPGRYTVKVTVKPK